MKTFEQFMEHHKKDADGKVIEHGDGTPSSVEEAKDDGNLLFGKTMKRNKKRFGKGGSPEPQGSFGQKPSQAAELAIKRRQEHKARRGVKEEVVAERLGGKGYKPYTSLTGKKVSGDWEDSDRGAGNKAKKRAGGKVEKKSPTYRAHVLNKEEIVSELNRYEKETGTSSGSMNMPKGKPTQKGGTKDPVMRAVRTSIRRETGKPHGQQKKTKGEKGNRQYGDRKFSPADTIAKRRQSRADAEKLMRDTRGT